MVEIDRAEIVPDDAHGVESIVTIGCLGHVPLQTGAFPERRYSWFGLKTRAADLSSDFRSVGLLGAALIGLRVGDQMPYFVAGCMNVVRVESVKRSKPHIDPLAPLLHVPAFANDDDDPGPTAA